MMDTPITAQCEQKGHDEGDDKAHAEMKYPEGQFTGGV
jgi:hypothetical protein